MLSRPRLSGGSPAGRRCGVLGDPIAHSLSPVLHRAAYAELGLDWTYDAHRVPSGGLAAFLRRPRRDVARAVADDAAQAGGAAAGRPAHRPGAAGRRGQHAGARAGGERRRRQHRPARRRRRGPGAYVGPAGVRGRPRRRSDGGLGRPGAGDLGVRTIDLLVRDALARRRHGRRAARRTRPTSTYAPGCSTRRTPAGGRRRGLHDPGGRPGARAGGARAPRCRWSSRRSTTRGPPRSPPPRSRRAGCSSAGSTCWCTRRRCSSSSSPARPAPLDAMRAAGRARPRGAEPRVSDVVLAAVLAALVAGLGGLLVPALIAPVPEPKPKPEPESGPEPILRGRAAEGAVRRHRRAAGPGVAQRRRRPRPRARCSGAAVGLDWPLLWLVPLTPGRGRAGGRRLAHPAAAARRRGARDARRARRGDRGRARRPTSATRWCGRWSALVAVRSFFWVLWFVRSAGMGFGDVRLAALVGLVLGWVGLGSAGGRRVDRLPRLRRARRSRWRSCDATAAAQEVVPVRPVHGDRRARRVSSGGLRSPGASGAERLGPCCDGSLRASPTAPPWSRSSRGCPPTSA